MQVRILAVLLAALAAGITAPAPSSAQDEGWVIRSFEGRYLISQDGTLSAAEDIIVDFGALERHGIFRTIPFEYRYDSDNNRLLAITDIAVDDGGAPQPFETSSSGGHLEIKIGDPDVEVTGVQRYRISYTVQGALNPFDTHDELFWNVTGNDWPVPIERVTAVVEASTPAIERASCFQGATGSTDTCLVDVQPRSTSFASTNSLAPGEGLTLVVALEKGAIHVPPLVLVPAGDAGPVEQVTDLFRPDALEIAVAVALLLAVLVGLGRLWWLIGRDRWYGDTYYRSDTPAPEETKPPFAHSTVVVEYQPPEVTEDGRRLRPAEVGLLMDERADTLDVSATIVDLAVRKYLLIREALSGGVFGLFQSKDYELEKLREADNALLLYEANLLDALFETGSLVQLSDLKNKFHDDLQDVKKDLYGQAVRANKYFPQDPDAVRSRFRLTGVGIAVGGGVLTWLLGRVWSAGFIGFPIIIAGVALFFLAPVLPRRSALGWETYRRCLGFRLYMVTAETDRQRFAEEENIFHEYLPYAIVFGCVEKWAKRFEVLGMEPQDGGWYVGSAPFRAALFADSVNTFSTSIGGVMASTPGGSGASGFGGGGGSGGGVGGGGGGSW